MTFAQFKCSAVNLNKRSVDYTHISTLKANHFTVRQQFNILFSTHLYVKHGNNIKSHLIISLQQSMRAHMQVLNIEIESDEYE